MTQHHRGIWCWFRARRYLPPIEYEAIMTTPAHQVAQPKLSPIRAAQPTATRAVVENLLRPHRKMGSADESAGK